MLFEIGQASGAFRSTLATTTGIGSQGMVMDGTEESRSGSTCPDLRAARLSVRLRSRNKERTPMPRRSGPAHAARVTTTSSMGPSASLLTRQRRVYSRCSRVPIRMTRAPAASPHSSSRQEPRASRWARLTRSWATKDHIPATSSLTTAECLRRRSLEAKRGLVSRRL